MGKGKFFPVACCCTCPHLLDGHDNKQYCELKASPLSKPPCDIPDKCPLPDYAPFNIGLWPTAWVSPPENYEFILALVPGVAPFCHAIRFCQHHKRWETADGVKFPYEFTHWMKAQDLKPQIDAIPLNQLIGVKDENNNSRRT